MMPSDLPSPGYLTNGPALHREVYKAINQARIQADLTGGESSCGADLKAFLKAAAEFLPAAKTTRKEPK